MFNILKKLSLALLIMSSAFNVSAATGTSEATEAVNKKNPYALIHQVSEQTFARIRDERSMIDEDINHLKVIVEDELMPYIHNSYAAKKVLGNHYRKLSKAEFKAFSTVFRRYMITTYANVFTLYDKQQVTYAPPQEVKKKKIVSVKLVIVDSSRPPIKISFKLRVSKKTGNWRAYDLVAQGISMVKTKQSEFNGVIRKHGIKYLINQLDIQAKKSIVSRVSS